MSDRIDTDIVRAQAERWFDVGLASAWSVRDVADLLLAFCDEVDRLRAALGEQDR